MPVQAQGKVAVRFQPFRNVYAKRWVVRTTLWPLYTWQWPCYPLYTRLGESQGWSGRARKTSPQLGLDFRVFRSEVSHYADYVIQSVITLSWWKIFYILEIEKFPITESWLQVRSFWKKVLRGYFGCKTFCEFHWRRYCEMKAAAAVTISKCQQKQ